MLLTVLSYAMIIVFMFVIMKKKMSPFTSLVVIPLIFTLVAMVSGVSKEGNIGDFVLEGIKTTSNTGLCCCLRYYTSRSCWTLDYLIRLQKK